MGNTNVEANLKQIRARQIDTMKDLDELRANADNGFLKSLDTINRQALSIMENVDEILGRRATRPVSRE